MPFEEEEEEEKGPGSYCVRMRYFPSKAGKIIQFLSLT